MHSMKWTLLNMAFLALGFIGAFTLGFSLSHSTFPPQLQLVDSGLPRQIQPVAVSLPPQLESAESNAQILKSSDAEQTAPVSADTSEIPTAKN